MGTLKTRRPTGLPSWPMILIAGAEKAGKSWSCAEASASDLIGRTLWIGVGEDDPDEYAAIPGADFEIAEHDGTYRGIFNAIDAAVAAPPTDGKPNLIVVDSMTRVWDLVCDMAQDTANTRAKRKASRENRAPGEDDAPISMDLWNTAKDRWQAIVAELRSHQGPVLLTARLDEVTVMDGNGKPTSAKTLKIKAEKSLPYDVGAVVQMPERGKAYLTGVRSARLQLPKPMPVPGFTVDKLWRDLGLHESAALGRVHAEVDRRDHDAPAQAAPVAVAAAPAPAPAEAPSGLTDAEQAAVEELLNRVLAERDVNVLRATYRDAPKATKDALVHVDSEYARVLGIDEDGPLGRVMAAAGKYVASHERSVDDAVLDPANDTPAAA